tara:strand:- start:1019 stop:1372 length:354 start_codon:yes stop_codon:yes gene_type:complete
MTVRFTTFRKINKNRFRKIYPLNHFPAVDGFLTDKRLVVETKLIDFSNSSEEVTTLDGNYTEIPVIIASGYSENSNEISNVNVFIDNIIVLGDKINVTVRSSDSFTGKVALQILEVS